MQAQHSPWLDELAKALTFFGSTLWTVAVVAAMAAWWMRRGQRPQCLAFLRGGLMGLLIQMALRVFVAQWRPDSGVVSPPTDWIMRYELAGFTSGHAFRAAYLYGWWFQALRLRHSAWAWMGAAGCAALILVVCATRVYLNRHWLTDVAGGVLVAMAMRAMVMPPRSN